MLIAANMLSMQLCARTDVHSQQSRHVGDLSSKMGTLLCRIATYPSGARRCPGASGGRAIAIAVPDGRRGRRGAIYAAKTTTDRSEAVLCTTDDSRWAYWNFPKFQLCSAFSQTELARPRAYDRERSTSSRLNSLFYSRTPKFAHARAPEKETKHGSPP